MSYSHDKDFKGIIVVEVLNNDLLTKNIIFMNEDLYEKIDRLKSASILDVPKIIMEIELYDEKSASDIFDEISNEMGKSELVDNVLNPSIVSILDGLLQHPSMKGITRECGLSANRVIQECKNFNYDGRAFYLLPDILVETRNQNASSVKWGKEHRNNYVRKIYHNTNEMNKYKKRRVEENQGRKNLQDEYRGTKDITPDKKNPDKRRNDPKHEYNAETDHVVPLNNVFRQLQNNMGLSNDDIREVVNKDYNFALTARKINNRKKAMSNSEFIALQDQNKAKGKPYIELSPETRENMIRMEKHAQENINNQVNSTVIKNIIGKGKADKAKVKEVISKKERELGRTLKPDERRQIEIDLGKKKTFDIHNENIGQAGKQTLGYVIGTSVLFVIKPLYYEIKDGIIFGFREGVMAETYKEAFDIRFQRIQKYVCEQLKSLENIFSSCMETLTYFMNALTEGLIGMFVGIFKNILKIIKEGVKVFIEAWPILFGKDSKKMSAAQKGDAIIKILGGTVVASLGIFLDQFFKNNASFIPENFRVVVSTMLTGIASAFLLYVLDKVDLFNVKKDIREQRLNEIFEERRIEIEMACKDVHDAVVNKIRETYIKTSSLFIDIKNALGVNDYKNVNNSLLQIAKVIGTSLPYETEEEFIQLKNTRKLNINRT